MLEPNRTYVIEDDGSIHKMLFCGDADWEENAVTSIQEIREKAIDEAIETAAKAICVGCGYLDGSKCTYKGVNCGVSKPMLEVVVKALEQLKGGAE